MYFSIAFFKFVEIDALFLKALERKQFLISLFQFICIYAAKWTLRNLCENFFHCRREGIADNIFLFNLILTSTEM